MNSLFCYRTLLRLPNFKGKARLIHFYRKAFYSPHILRVDPGLQLGLQPIDWLQSDLLRDGSLEPLTSALFANILRSGDSYVDVGAHIGFHTLLARHIVGTTGRLLAVEPQPRNGAQLLANCQLNGFNNVELYIAAAGERDDMIALPVQADSDTSRLTLSGAGVNDQAQQFHVPILRLDSLLARHDLERVRLLKIDVEGYELEVIRGLGDRLETVDHIIFELLDPSHAATAAICEHLESRGFALKTVKGDTWDRRQLVPENNIWATR